MAVYFFLLHTPQVLWDLPVNLHLFLLPFLYRAMCLLPKKLYVVFAITEA